ncbi:hypothetical protein HDV62DRAFT_399293 [Trichoderma sp. SZMC 28011]
MSKATNAQEFITEFANAFSGSGDSVKLDEFFADDVVFSDYMMPNTVGLDKKGWLNHCANYYANVHNMRAKTFNVFGDIDDLVGWEYRFTFTSKKDNPEMGVKEGEDITLRGMSVFKLRRSEKGLQIVEERDYYNHLKKAFIPDSLGTEFPQKKPSNIFPTHLERETTRQPEGRKCAEQKRFTVAKSIVFGPSGGLSWNHVRRSSLPILSLPSTPPAAEVGAGTGIPAHAGVPFPESCEDRGAGIGVQWANAAKEYPEWWAQSHGDNLLFRRTKRRLRSEYDQSRKDKGKKRAIDLQQAFPVANSGDQWSSHHETLGTLSSQTDVFDYLPISSLENPSNTYQRTSNSNIYPSFSAASRQVWDDGLGERFPTAQGLLETTCMPELGQGAASAANASTMYPSSEYQPDIWTAAYEPSQPNLTFGQVWGEGSHATQSERPQHEVMQQTPSLNNAVLNLDDRFWNDMLAFGDEFALGSHTDTGEGSSNNPRILCDRDVLG